MRKAKPANGSKRLLAVTKWFLQWKLPGRRIRALLLVRRALARVLAPEQAQSLALLWELVPAQLRLWQPALLSLVQLAEVLAPRQASLEVPVDA